jgi:soluble lytic murein transglycosylase
MFVKTISIMLVAMLAHATPALASSLTLDNQRGAFVAAERAIKQGDYGEYRRLKAGLKDYPLYAYLLYDEALGHVKRSEAGPVLAFLEHYGDSPLADRIRARWLRHLAKRNDWRDYAQVYQESSNSELQCLYLRALMETGRVDEMLDQVEPLWLYGKSRPAACDPAFNAWRAAGRLTTKLVWGRIELAMEENNTKLARYLERYLPSADKALLGQWLKVHSSPTLVTDRNRFTRNHPMRQKVLIHGVERLVRSEGAESALNVWRNIKGRYPFSEEEAASVEGRIALQLMWDDNPKALAYLASVPAAHRDETLIDTGVREAVGLKQWQHIVDLIAATPVDERNEYQRYWYGRSLEKLGRPDEAEPILRELAKERTYHGFLAADRVGLPYHLDNIPVPVDQALLARVENLPAVQRARELFALRRMVDARREWYKMLKSMDVEEKKAFSKLAQGWGWHSRAIFTLAKTDYWDDLDLRFPLEHKRHIQPIASERALDFSWVFAVVRQESAFIPDARSHSGALGLMQLMPGTANDVARKLKMKRPGRSELIKPEVNITLGTSYLREMLDRLGQHPILATAAYNAGPHRVVRWLPDGLVPADEWVATIPFTETRGYVERIMAYTVIYDARLGFEPRRLADTMMHPIGKDESGKVSAVVTGGNGAG